MTIQHFSGLHRFLSNFYINPIKYKGAEYLTVEHAFQAAKTTDLLWKGAIQRAPTPAKAKKLGRCAPMRPDWEQTKIAVMEEILKIKFEDSLLQEYLIATGEGELVHGNWYKDKFWGVDVSSGVGENHLGKLLTKIRKELIRETGHSARSDLSLR